jgi:hypothetical protein
MGIDPHSFSLRPPQLDSSCDRVIPFYQRQSFGTFALLLSETNHNSVPRPQGEVWFPTYISTRP